MKLTVFLILLGLLRVSAVTNAQVYRINLELENVACEEAIESLKGQTNLDFFFSNREVNVNRKVSVSCKNASLEEALKQILGEGYSFRLIDNTVVIRPVKNQLPQPKQVTVKGTVKDVKGNPLPGVTVLLKGSALGISTDNDGKFTVSFPEMKDVVLLFSFIGMKSQEVKYTGQMDIKVVLEEDVKEMDEVVVTGIMERKAESFTGSATVVKGDDLKRVGNTNIFQSLKNLDPTVFVMDNLDMGSNPNALPEMNMRGGTSFPGGEVNSDLKGNYENKPNQPLFVLDGFEVSAETIFDLDMQRVESLTILKDAAAKAIYGSKAANGVVVIETKRLDATKPRISYTGSLDLNMPDLSSYDLCNALEKLDVEFAEGVYDVNDPNDMEKYYALRKKVLEGQDTYWLSKPLQFGYGHKHSLMIELGKDELRTSLNFSYSNNVGIMKKSGRENLSGTFNLQYNYKNKLRFQNNASFTQNKSEDTPYGSFSTYAVLNPYESMYDEDGLLAVQIGDRPNPFRDGEIGTSLTSSYRQFINNTSLEWTIIEGLRLRGKLGITVKNNDADQFYPASHSKFANYKGENAARKGSYQVNNGKSSTLSGELLLNWYKQFNEKHNLFINLGYNLSETISSEVINYAEGFPSDNMNDIMFATQYMKDMRPSGITQTKRDIGILGTLSYTYLDKYLLDFTLRSNGSSIFGNDKRWATFWSVGIGWNLHKELFLSDVEWLNTLKLRASIGTTGNQNFQNNKSIAINGYYTADRYRGAIGSYLQNMQNPELKWEQKMDYNIGLDAVFMGVDIRMDFYKSITKDLVSSVGIAPSTGFTTVSENLGKVENKGFEMEIGWNDQIRDFAYSASLNISHIKNKVLDLGYGQTVYNTTLAKTVIGEPLGMWYLYKMNGIFQSEEEVRNYVNSEGKIIQPNALPGDIKYDDYNGDGNISSEDRQIIGPGPNLN